MEKDKTTKKKSIKFAQITSKDKKVELIKKINAFVKDYAEKNEIEVNLIPVEPLPNISFWVNDEEKRCGVTISRQHFKWGWCYYLDNDIWRACSYMEGMGFDKVYFDEELTKYLKVTMIDYCSKHAYIQEVAANSKL